MQRGVVRHGVLERRLWLASSRASGLPAGRRPARPQPWQARAPRAVAGGGGPAHPTPPHPQHSTPASPCQPRCSGQPPPPGCPGSGWGARSLQWEEVPAAARRSDCWCMCAACRRVCALRRGRPSVLGPGARQATPCSRQDGCRSSGRLPPALPAATAGCAGTLTGAQRLHSGNSLHRARRAQQVADHGLGGVDLEGPAARRLRLEKVRALIVLLQPTTTAGLDGTHFPTHKSGRSLVGQRRGDGAVFSHVARRRGGAVRVDVAHLHSVRFKAARGVGCSC